MNLVWIAPEGEAPDCYEISADGKHLTFTNGTEFPIGEELHRATFEVRAIKNGVKSEPCRSFCMTIYLDFHGHPVVEWPTVAGEWYTLERSTDGCQTWDEVGNYVGDGKPLVIGDGKPLVIGGGTAQSARFRIKVLGI